MKVAELREKAKEFEIETTGKKKAELVEEIYVTAAKAEGFRDIKGILQIRPDSSGIIHAHGYMKSNDDAFVPAYLIRSARLRTGDVIEGSLRPSRGGDKRAGLAKITTVNGLDPEQIRNRPKFGDLTPVYPNEPLRMEHGKDSITGRAIDIVSPIGKGQRGLIVSPPKAGKTTILKKICQSISINNPEVHLICLLVDERPEEVTDMQRSRARHRARQAHRGAGRRCRGGARLHHASCPRLQLGGARLRPHPFGRRRFGGTVSAQALPGRSPQYRERWLAHHPGLCPHRHRLQDGRGHL